VKSVLVLILSCLPLAAHASGCIGGDWQTVEDTKLPPAQIDSYDTKNEVEVLRNLGTVYWTTFTPVNANGKLLKFFSQQFDLSAVGLSDMLIRLNEKDRKFTAAVQKIVTVNQYYDDCQDIPENTTQTVLRYTFPLILSDGNQIVFTAEDVAYDPPLRP
jgi:hypothetical protein